jgi:hypothetical protein
MMITWALSIAISHHLSRLWLCFDLGWLNIDSACAKKAQFEGFVKVVSPFWKWFGKTSEVPSTLPLLAGLAILGISSSQLTNSIIFQRGRLNHQPVEKSICLAPRCWLDQLGRPSRWPKIWGHLCSVKYVGKEKVWLSKRRLCYTISGVLNRGHEVVNISYPCKLSTQVKSSWKWSLSMMKWSMFQLRLNQTVRLWLVLNTYREM